MTYILDSDRTIVTGDFNAHHHMWYSPMTDHRGTLIADKINNSDHLTLNTDSHTRHPTNRNQQPTSHGISTATNRIHNNITWTTLDAINSDHKPIAIQYKTKTKFRLTQNRLSYTNYKKADWTNFTRQIEGLLNANDIQELHKFSNFHSTNKYNNSHKINKNSFRLVNFGDRKKAHWKRAHRKKAHMYISA